MTARPALLAVLVTSVAIGVTAVVSLHGEKLDRPPSGPAVAAAAPHPAAATLPLKSDPSPPLEGRIPLNSKQAGDAYRSGLIDRPVKSLLDITSPMKFGNFVWNDTGVPPGPVWIRVDLGSQLLSVFRSGHEIGTTVILYGADGFPTPTGKFHVLAKLKDHRSVTYGDAPMPYTLRLTGDGVSIHGSNVRRGFATHGCVGIPRAFAAKVFDVVSTGDEVLIVSRDRTRSRT